MHPEMGYAKIRINTYEAGLLEAGAPRREYGIELSNPYR